MKITLAEIINIKNEIHTREMYLKKITEKAERLGLNKNDLDIANAHMKWISENEKIVKEFYKPATIIQ